MLGVSESVLLTSIGRGSAGERSPLPRLDRLSRRAGRSDAHLNPLLRQDLDRSSSEAAAEEHVDSQTCEDVGGKPRSSSVLGGVLHDLDVSRPRIDEGVAWHPSEVLSHHVV